MTTWESRRLDELVKFKTGKLDSNAAVAGGEYPFFTCSQDTLRTNTFSFDTECVLLGGNNANGIYPLKYFRGKFDAYQRTYVIVSKDSSVLFTRFLYYALRPKLSEFRSVSTGAATKFLTLTILNATEIPVPTPAVQRRIAGILSAYDDLIENCERRIRVLDEMARSLYREWFVHFRYPGHDKTPLVVSPLGPIPKGWACSDVGALSDGPDGVQTGPFGSQLHQAEYSAEGVPIVMPKDLRGFRIDDSDIARVPEGVAERVSRHRLKAGDIVYGRRGDIGRRAFVMSHQVGTICGTGCLRIRPKLSLIDGWYLFHYLGQDNVVSLIAGRAQGVTMPNLNTRLLATVPILVPPRALQSAFRTQTFELAEQRERLLATTNNLRRTRDLLLPRLLSGELSVEDVA